jgi:TolB-like protein
MNKLGIFGSFLLLLATTAYTQSITIDSGIKTSAEYFNQQLQNGLSVAVLGVESDSRTLSAYIMNELTSYFVNGSKFTVVDRQNLDRLQEEVDYQLSGEVSDETAQSIGTRIGAQTVILGSIRQVGNVYRLDLRAVSVESGAIQGIYGQDITNDGRLSDLLRGGQVLTAADSRKHYLSFGVGGLFLSDFNAGFIGQTPTYYVDRKMPQLGGGVYVFFDATYAELSIAFSIAGGKDKSEGIFGTLRPEFDFSMMNLNFALFGKYPLTINKKLSAFPLLGIEYAMCLNAVENGLAFIKEDGGRAEAMDFSSLWFKLGAGLDISFTNTIYLRCEALYGVRLRNKFEKDFIDFSSDGTAYVGHGLTARVAVGFML